MRGNEDYFERVRSELDQCEGVERVLVNPKTASVLVLERAGADTEAVERFSRERRLFRLVAPETPPEVMTERLSKFFDLGEADARRGLFALFLLGGLYQLARGNVWPASMTFSGTRSVCCRSGETPSAARSRPPVPVRDTAL
jgi:hypothetical protein